MNTFDLIIPLRDNREIILKFLYNEDTNTWNCSMNNETKEDIEYIMENEQKPCV
jgi:hypothetical protein